MNKLDFPGGMLVIAFVLASGFAVSCAPVVFRSLEHSLERASQKHPPGSLRTSEISFKISDGAGVQESSGLVVHKVLGPGNEAGTLKFGTGSFLTKDTVSFYNKNSWKLVVRLRAIQDSVLVSSAAVYRADGSKIGFYVENPMINSLDSYSRLEDAGFVRYGELFRKDGSAVRNYGFQILDVKTKRKHFRPNEYEKFIQDHGYAGAGR